MTLLITIKNIYVSIVVVSFNLLIYHAKLQHRATQIRMDILGQRTFIKRQKCKINCTAGKSFRRGRLRVQLTSLY